MTLVLRYIARSDRGLVRSNNEDSVYAGARLLALADGMGGHAAGEVASQLVIQALRTLDDDEPGGDLLDKLDRATHTGNAAIAAQVEQAPELDGMGTTLTAILFAGSRIGLCHIGDSRGYLYRDEQLTQITRDDTFVQTLVEDGRITAEQAHTHPQRSLIMRALTGTEVEPTLTIREARAGDRYLLCSDGLSDVVTEETLADTLGSIADHRECADRLIELALRGGGPDNVTVIVADVVDTEYGESRPILGGAAGDDEAYVPNPATAAGRAAALRPPPEEPQRPTIFSDDEEPRPRHPLRKWVIAGLALLIIAVVVVGLLVTRAMLQNNYFVRAEDGNVVIYQGSPDKVLFVDLSSGNQQACVTRLDAETPEIEFADFGGDATCTPLQVSDLAELDRTAVTSKSIKNLGLAEAENRVRHLNFLPLCPDPEPVAPPVPARPAPRGPAVTPAPPAATAAPATNSSSRPSPGSSTSSDSPDSSQQSPPQYDSDGTKTCRGH
ncbi:PP2C family protein-serine/threonine phosphatase [Gordonia soli]|uniref:Serine/threonine protein phosphatase PstP n=1 Tax=Gordonia soli NBRC 108243 TaxID=1223545 RepID=M0QNY7_9ACTN|nr:PP2C family serine/threonine-protein phosphatase [Gordonia soli]GAC69157.1 serine/threonine protein phosphatase PstP [Gordonia soli NBRC 108243]